MAQLRKLNAKNALQTKNQCVQCKKVIQEKLIRFRDQNYHLECFKCTQCGNTLQNAVVYAEGSKRVCEPCHLKTVDKCSACQKPILDEKAALGDLNFHRQCLRCAGPCGQVLGEVFYETDDNRFMCGPDYRDHFLPLCAQCQKRMKAQSSNDEGHLVYYVTFQDKKYHAQCFFCDQCHRALESTEPNSSDPNAQCRRLYYALDSRKLCLECYTQTLQLQPRG